MSTAAVSRDHPPAGDAPNIRQKAGVADPQTAERHGGETGEGDPWGGCGGQEKGFGAS
jgi:hypothetical protein